MFSTTTIKLLPNEKIKKIADIQVSRRLLSYWKVKTNEEITLFFGLTSVPVNITSIDEKEFVIHCSEALFSHLLLPIKNHSLHCDYLPSENKLILGPIVALLTEIKEQAYPVSFGTLSSFCEEIAHLAQNSGCFFYVTSLPLWNEKQIQGYYYENEKWHKATMPFPHVVHNRIHSRKTEQGIMFQRLQDILSKQGTPYFNTRFLNKWEVYESLQAAPHLQPYVPPTELFRNMKILEESLDLYTVVFVKPVFGSQGRHIFKIQKHTTQYILEYTSFQDEIQTCYDSSTKLFQSIKQQIKQKPYIVQKGLDLYTFKERPLDFRILCHMNSYNKWKVTSAVARVSSKEQFVSNVALGGEIHKIDDVLRYTFDAKTTQHIKKLLAELALETAKCISLTYEGLFGELGIDMAIDKEGNPWIIEVNSKPSKELLPAASMNSIRPSVKSVLYYCIHIAQQFHKE
ncbi:YheC/YheD family protein [Bacillus sp. 165]|uniref:YheC/YheD family endospore coat-associated protein n=1 Tax=Bacillus sp. 165 TaxID=1529117 RepID=UPI001ADC6CA3|nr:YheC/YheD family protein [Bacillus sp. 165]MBO9128748.1 YheC/YheD family protein [Bacillus sp. 165]